MSIKSYLSEFKEHPIHNALQSFMDDLINNRPETTFPMADNEQARDIYIRLRLTLKSLKYTLSKINPVLLQTAKLNSIHGELNNVQTHWNSFKSNVNQLPNVKTHYDRLLVQIAPYIYKSQSLDIDIDKVRFEELRSSLEHSYDSVKIQLQELTEENTRLKDEQEKADKQILQFTTEINSQKQRIDTLITNQSQQFTSSQEERSKQMTEIKSTFDSNLSAWNTQVEDNKKEALEKLEAVRTNSIERKDTLIKEIEEALEHAQKTLKAVVGTCMTGNYQNIAKRELISAWVMRILAVISFCLMVWVLKDMVRELADPKMKDNLNWMVIALRFGSGIALVIPAVYCARESARHWRNESRHRRISLELAAIEPYLSQLDEVERKKAYSEKVNDYFVGHSDQLDPDEKDSLKNLNLNVNQFLKLAEKITKLQANIGLSDN